jgi:hypothetical protein
MSYAVPDRDTRTHRNNVEAASGLRYAAGTEIVAGRINKVSQFEIVNGLHRVHQGIGPACPHLHEYDDAPPSGDDVDLPQWAQIVAFQDAVAAKEKVASC